MLCAVVNRGHNEAARTLNCFCLLNATSLTPRAELPTARGTVNWSSHWKGAAAWRTWAHALDAQPRSSRPAERPSGVEGRFAQDDLQKNPRATNWPVRASSATTAGSRTRRVKLRRGHESRGCLSPKRDIADVTTRHPRCHDWERRPLRPGHTKVLARSERPARDEHRSETETHDVPEGWRSLDHTLRPSTPLGRAGCAILIFDQPTGGCASPATQASALHREGGEPRASPPYELE